MYENVKARIRCGAKFTDYINCTRGVKQGDMCSPVLFSLFIIELALDIINNGRHGVSLNNDFVQLVILFSYEMLLDCRSSLTVYLVLRQGYNLK